METEYVATSWYNLHIQKNKKGAVDNPADLDPKPAIHSPAAHFVPKTPTSLGRHSRLANKLQLAAKSVPFIAVDR